MSITDAAFNAIEELKNIRDRRNEARRKLFRKSRLDRFRVELAAMRQAGASCADLVEWLRVRHRCKINRSSVDRYLRSLPELNDMNNCADQDDTAIFNSDPW